MRGRNRLDGGRFDSAVHDQRHDDRTVRGTDRETVLMMGDTALGSL